MSVHLFIDETGTISNARVKGHYGFGWVTAEESQISNAVKILKANNLGHIHVKNQRKRKVHLATKIGKAQLENTDIMGGALIRKNSGFAAAIVKKNIEKQNGKLSEDEISGLYSAARMQELLILATRYPLIAAIKKYGHADIVLNFSAINNPNVHAETLARMGDIFLEGLEKILTYFHHLNILKLTPNQITKSIEIKVIADSSGLFGLADFFAYVGRKIASNNTADNLEGFQMYSATKKLYQPKIFDSIPEIEQGIFVRN